jgi:acyl carrier protein
MQIQEVISLVAKALDENPTKINEQTTSDQVDNWDSLGHIQIMQALDEAYDEVTTKIPELGSATSVHEIYTLIAHLSLGW